MADADEVTRHWRIARFLRGARARPRLIVSVAFGLAVYAATGLPALAGQELWATTRALIGWDAGVAVYLGLALHLMASSDTARIRRQAETQDDGKSMILILTVLATAASVAAIVSELSAVPDLPDGQKSVHVLLAAVTIPAAWFFVHTAFALHYAHDYYGSLDEPGAPGLDIPDEPEPDYFDFLYFSFILGTSAQTADISIRSRAMRRISLVHCTLAFFFNTTVLALTINIAASLIGK
jgi:uncharacterized membrane protein